MERPPSPPKVLTIAGSDSGGAAGLQADLKTLSSLGVYGTCAITIVTAQNSTDVVTVQEMSAEMVAVQISAVLSDYGTDIVKTGIIGSVDLIEAAVKELKKVDVGKIVVDPVLVNHRGDSMFDPDVTQAYHEVLFPIATLATPNIKEAELIVGSKIKSLTNVQEAAKSIQAVGPIWVLIKGWKQQNQIMDVLFGDGAYYQFSSRLIDTANTHGSGDTLSAAICAFLARGFKMVEAVENAHRYTHKAIRNAAEWRLGRGHGPVYHGKHNLS